MPPLRPPRGPNKKCWEIFNAACAARSGELILALDEQLPALEDLSKPEPRAHRVRRGIGPTRAGRYFIVGVEFRG